MPGECVLKFRLSACSRFVLMFAKDRADDKAVYRLLNTVKRPGMLQGSAGCVLEGVWRSAVLGLFWYD